MTRSAPASIPSLPPSPFTEAGFRRLAGQRLLPAPPATFDDFNRSTAHQPSDYDLNPDLRHLIASEPPPKPAAVLVPIVARDPLSVLLTVRTEHLPSHAGQISFPGGKVDKDDASPVATALREAQEEIGLDPAAIEPLGFLDVYLTRTGYRVLPVVGLVAPDYEPHPNPGEVADVFEVPLAFLMDTANHQRHSRLYQGVERYFFAMPYGDRFIWGATAGMLRNLHARLFEP